MISRRQFLLTSIAGSLAVPVALGFGPGQALAKSSDPASASAKLAQFDILPDISTFELDNGLQVVVIPDRRAPVVTHMVWYKVGSADEPRGKSGIAHYLEHLMFKGTKRFGPKEFSQKVAEVGGQENAFTGSDYTAYHQTITPEALEMVMDMEADRMENLILNDETVLPERKVILEERRGRIASNPGSILQESVQATMFTNHPYGIPVIGWENEMLQLTKEDAIAFYDRFYTPNNAILVVAGDVDKERVKELAQKTYGKVKRRADPPAERVRVSEPEPLTERRVKYSDPRITRPSWQRTYLVPSYRIAEGNEAYALDLLSLVLGGSSTSRIDLALVLDNPVAASAGSYYSGGALDMGQFGVYATPRGDTTLDQLESDMDTVIGKLQKDGVSQEELDRSRSALLKSTIYDRDSQSSLANLVGSVLATGGTIEDIRQWPQKLQAVSVEDINGVARKYLKKTRSVTGILLPGEAENTDNSAESGQEGEKKS